jgi:hypothetical protein
MLGRQIHIAEPLVPGPSASEVELAIEELKSHKSSGIDQIPAELIKAGSRTIYGEIHKLILFGVRRNCLRGRSSRSLYLSIKRVIKQIVAIIGHITFANYVQNFIQHPALKVNSICRGNY